MRLVPQKISHVAGFTRVKPGESLAAVCGRFGQPVSSYTELVGANLHRELDLSGPPEMVATLAGIREGDVLYIPAEWVRRSRVDLEGGAGVIADELVDQIANLYPNVANLPPDKYKVLVETLGGWWRADHPGDMNPTKAQLNGYANSLLSWYDAIGKQLTSNIAERIPWAQVPWAFIAAMAKENFPWWTVNADKINTMLKTRVVPGTAKHLPQIKHWDQSVWDKASLHAQHMDETALWTALTKFRWDLFPDGAINPTTFKFGMNAQDWLVDQINKVYPNWNADAAEANQDTAIDFLSCGLGKVKIGGQCYGVVPANAQGGCPAGSIFYSGVCVQTPCGATEQASVDPTKGIICAAAGGGPSAGGCPPGAIAVNGSCDCTPLGPGYSYDPKDNSCNFCGPNSVYNTNDGNCYCVAGYIFDPSGAPGCIKSGGGCPPGATETNGSCDCTPLGPGYSYDPKDNSCNFCGPNSVYNTNDGNCYCVAGYVFDPSGAPGCIKEGGGSNPCGAGTKLVNGQCVPDEKPTQEKKEGVSAGQVAVGVGVLLGLVAVAYKLRKK